MATKERLPETRLLSRPPEGLAKPACGLILGKISHDTPCKAGGFRV